jgi:hypothetical protein
MDKKIETAYITTITKTAKKTRSIGIRKRMIAIRSEQYGENRVHPLPSLRE